MARYNLQRGPKTTIRSHARCVVRCRRCLHGPRHRPSGTWLSSGIMPAPPAAAPSTRAPDHLHPLLVRCRLRHAHSFVANRYGSLPHTRTCAVCGKLSIGFIMSIARSRGVLYVCECCGSVRRSPRVQLMSPKAPRARRSCRELRLLRPFGSLHTVTTRPLSFHGVWVSRCLCAF